MPTGKPGGDPLTDILLHKREVFGADVDDLIREISELSSRHEMHEWWTAEMAGVTDRAQALQKAQTRVDELTLRSRSSGWKAV
jgi:hypothetical protein